MINTVPSDTEIYPTLSWTAERLTKRSRTAQRLTQDSAETNRAVPVPVNIALNHAKYVAGIHNNNSQKW